MAGHDRDIVGTDQGGTGQGWNTPRLRRALGMGVLTGVVTTFPFWKIPRKPLMLVSGIVAATATTAGVVLARDQAEREAAVQGEPRPETCLAQRIAGPVLTGAFAGGVVAGTLWLSSVTDELSEKAMAKLGARRPRAAIAVVSGVGAAVIEYFDSEYKPKDNMSTPKDQNIATPKA